MKTLNSIKNVVLKAFVAIVLVFLLIVAFFNVNVTHANTLRHRPTSTVVYREIIEFRSVNK